VGTSLSMFAAKKSLFDTVLNRAQNRWWALRPLRLLQCLLQTHFDSSVSLISIRKDDCLCTTSSACISAVAPFVVDCVNIGEGADDVTRALQRQVCLPMTLKSTLQNGQTVPFTKDPVQETNTAINNILDTVKKIVYPLYQLWDRTE